MKNNTTITTWLFTPFKFIAGSKALVIGLIILLILSVLGYLSNTHFDGALDVHYGCPETIKPYTVHLFYQIVGWLSLSLIFYITAKIVSKSDIRIVDILGTLALAQAPLLLAALAGFIPAFHICFGDLNSLDIASLLAVLKDNIVPLIIISIISILFSLWSIWLIYNAYSISANVKGVVGIVSFIIALLVAEIISKITLYFFIPILF